MSDKPIQDNAAEVYPTGKPFGEMSGGEKVKWLCKALVMLATGGFVYPNIFVE